MRVLYGACLGIDEWMDHEKWGRNREPGRGACVMKVCKRGGHDGQSDNGSMIFHRSMFRIMMWHWCN